MAETKTFTAEAASAFGNELPAKVYYDYSIEALQTMAEVPAEEMLSAADQLLVINNARKAKARQKAMLNRFAELAKGIPEGQFNPYKVPVVNDSEQGILVAARDTVKTLVKTGNTEEVAKQKAAALFGVSIDLL